MRNIKLKDIVFVLAWVLTLIPLIMVGWFPIVFTQALLMVIYVLNKVENVKKNV